MAYVVEPFVPPKSMVRREVIEKERIIVREEVRRLARIGQLTITSSNSPYQFPKSILEGISNIRVILIEADEANSADIYIGHDESVNKSNGYKLSPAKAISIETDDLNVYFYTESSSEQKIYYMVFIKSPEVK